MIEALILNSNFNESEKIESALGSDVHCTFVTCKDEAASLVKNINFDLIIVGLNEEEDCLLFLKEQKAPLFATASKISIKDKARADDLGAIDLIETGKKPQEFRAKILGKLKGLSKRSSGLTYEKGPISADYERQTLKIKNRQINLTQIEFKILMRLLKSPGEPISRGSLCESLNIQGQIKGSRKVDAHISNLRRKLGNYDRILGSVYGQGYVFRENFL